MPLRSWRQPSTRRVMTMPAYLPVTAENNCTGAICTLDATEEVIAEA